MTFDVGISKHYFPYTLFPEELVQEFFEMLTIRAMSRIDAATIVWSRHRSRWLILMKPKLTRLPRIVSLHVSGNNGTPPGRLVPIKVYEEK